MKWNPRRTVIRFHYRYHRGFNNSDGAFSVPPTDRSPISGRPRRATPFTASADRSRPKALRNLNAQISLDANSGSPYTITTGSDDNGDSIFNDRPLLTPRNSLRLPWRATLSGNVSYTIPLGAQATGQPAFGGDRDGGRGRARSKGVTFNVSVSNLTDRANYTGSAAS